MKNWKVGYSSQTQKYVPIPFFGNMSYSEAKMECDRLNEISKEAKKK